MTHRTLAIAAKSDTHHKFTGDRRRARYWGVGTALQRGGMLNDLLIDVLLLAFLPTATSYTRATLLEGQQGPYWHIVDALGGKVPQPIILSALFGADADRLVLEGYLNETMERGDAAT